MKIKTKKTMTLCELIKWSWENPELTNDKKFFRETVVTQVLLNFVAV